ncbi:MAG: hypothetical protein WCF98_04720 [Synechococcus sp. ELA057]
MSFVITDTSTVFTAPTTVAAPAPTTNPSAVNATTTAVQLGGGSVTGTNNGTVGSTTVTNPVTWATTAASGGQTQQVVVSGAGTRLNLATGAAKVQAIGGGTIIESTQSTADTTNKVISLGDPTAPYNGAAVASTATVSSVTVNNGVATTSTVTIASAAGNQGGPFAFYAHGGFGNDSIEGSNLADFIRGGAGNDTINGFGGNDLIRGGTGSDSIFGGVGADTLYYTADQFPTLGSTDTDTFADFATGTDKISIDRTVVASTSGITGIGTNTVTISGPTGTGSVRIVSQGTAINAGDFNFI